MEQNLIQESGEDSILFQEKSDEEVILPPKKGEYKEDVTDSLRKQISEARIKFIEKEISLLEQELITASVGNLSLLAKIPEVLGKFRKVIMNAPGNKDELRELIVQKKRELATIKAEITTGNIDYGTVDQMYKHHSYLENATIQLGNPQKAFIVGKNRSDEEDTSPVLEHSNEDTVQQEHSGNSVTKKIVLEDVIPEERNSNEEVQQPKTIEELRKNGIFDLRTEKTARELADLKFKLPELKKALTDAKLHNKKDNQEVLDAQNELGKAQEIIAKDQIMLNALHDSGFVEMFTDMSDDELLKKMQQLEKRVNEEFVRQSTLENDFRKAENLLSTRKAQRRELEEIGGDTLERINNNSDLTDAEVDEQGIKFSEDFFAAHPILHETDEMMDKNYLNDVYGPPRTFVQGTGKDIYESDFVIRAEESQEYLRKVLAERAAERLATQKPEIKVLQPKSDFEVLFEDLRTVEAKATNFLARYDVDAAANDSTNREATNERLSSLRLSKDNFKKYELLINAATERLTALTAISTKLGKELKFATTSSASIIRQQQVENQGNILELDKEISALKVTISAKTKELLDDINYLQAVYYGGTEVDGEYYGSLPQKRGAGK